MKKLLFLFVFGVVLFHVFTVCAEEKMTSIRLVTSEWPGYTNKDGTGLYFDVIKAVYEPVGIKVEFELVPWKRAQKMVKEKADALVGEYFLPKAGYLYPKWPIDVEDLTILFKKGKIAEWKGEASLENKKVAWIRGYDFQENIKIKMEISEIDEVKSGLLMLAKDRIDFLVDYEDSIKEEAQKMRDFDLAQNQMEQLRLGEKIYVAFVNSERGKKLVEIFDTQMAQLYESGVLDTMYKNFTQWHYDGYPK